MPSQDTNMPKQNDSSRKGMFDPTILYRQQQEQQLTPPRANTMLNSAFGAYLPDYNILAAPSINDKDTGLTKEGLRSTLAHESTHAWTSNILVPLIKEISEKDEPTPEEKQFLEASKKLSSVLPYWDYGSKRENIKEYKSYNAYIKKLMGDADISNERKESREIPAYAIGNMAAGATPVKDEYGVSKGGSHQDATITTDYSILMEMIDRLPAETKINAANKRKKELENPKSFAEPPLVKQLKRLSKEDMSNPFFTSDEFKNPLLK
jgi:hypothetical protein